MDPYEEDDTFEDNFNLVKELHSQRVYLGKLVIGLIVINVLVVAAFTYSHLYRPVHYINSHSGESSPGNIPDSEFCDRALLFVSLIRSYDPKTVSHSYARALRMMTPRGVSNYKPGLTKDRDKIVAEQKIATFTPTEGFPKVVSRTKDLVVVRVKGTQRRVKMIKSLTDEEDGDYAAAGVDPTFDVAFVRTSGFTTTVKKTPKDKNDIAIGYSIDEVKVYE